MGGNKKSRDVYIRKRKGRRERGRGKVEQRTRLKGEWGRRGDV